MWAFLTRVWVDFPWNCQRCGRDIEAYEEHRCWDHD
jgi:hypothetical protein